MKAEQIADKQADVMSDQNSNKSKTVTSGLESESDSDDGSSDCYWSYVWPKELVRHFFNNNNSSITIAEKYDEYRIHPLEAV